MDDNRQGDIEHFTSNLHYVHDGANSEFWMQAPALLETVCYLIEETGVKFVDLSSLNLVGEKRE